MSLLPGFLLTDRQSHFQEPLDNFAEVIEGRCRNTLSSYLLAHFEDQAVWAFWPSQTRVDVGAWFRFPKCFLLITADALHLVADAPSWLGGELMHKQLPYADIEAVRFNDVTAELVVRFHHAGLEWPALLLDPLDGHQAVLLIERFLHDN
jgi:hypothetical protein